MHVEATQSERVPHPWACAHWRCAHWRRALEVRPKIGSGMLRRWTLPLLAVAISAAAAAEEFPPCLKEETAHTLWDRGGYLGWQTTGPDVGGGRYCRIVDTSHPYFAKRTETLARGTAHGRNVLEGVMDHSKLPPN